MRLYKNLLLIALIAGLAALFAAVPAFAETVGVVTAPEVSVREKPHPSGGVLAQYNAGEAVTVIERVNEYVKIQYNEYRVAYINFDKIQILEADATVITDDVNIRKGPSKDGEIIAKAAKGDVVSVIGITGGFYAFDYKGETAYINKDLVTGEFIGYVTEASESLSMSIATSIYAVVNSPDGLNLRKGASQDAEVIKKLPDGYAMGVIKLGDEWHYVSADGIEGYVSAEYIFLYPGEKPVNAQGSAKGIEIVNYGQQFLGTKYVWGGTDLRKGVDCSGFTYSVYKHFGITLNRTSRDQIKNGAPVSKESLAAGDLVFFSNSGNKNIQHVGIYIGDSKFIHASSGKKYQVTISSLNENYYLKNYVGACRVIK